MSLNKLIFQVAAALFLIVSASACLSGGKDKSGNDSPESGPSSGSGKVAAHREFAIDDSIELIRPFAAKSVWGASKSKVNTVVRLVGDQFQALDGAKFGGHFEVNGKVPVAEIVSDSYGNIYFGALVTGGSFVIADLVMLKKSGVNDPDQAAGWLPISFGGNDTAADAKKIGAAVSSVFRTMTIGFDKDIVIATVPGVSLGKTQNDDSPIFYDNGTRRWAAVFDIKKMVVTQFSNGNDYLGFKPDETVGSTHVSAAIFGFNKSMGAKAAATSFVDFAKGHKYDQATFTATNKGKAAWLATTDNSTLARIVPKGTGLAVSEQLTHSSTDLDSSPIVGFAPIGTTTWVLLKNGKLYYLDEATIDQEFYAAGDKIKNHTSVKFIEAKLKGITLTEGRDIRADGTTLWLLDKGKAHRIENADVAVAQLK